MKILFSNIGYARGIDGTLWQHVSRMGRHFYCRVPLQTEVLAQLKSIIRLEEPDICCFVEVDQGSFQSAKFNQMYALIDEHYHFFDIASKYGQDTWLDRMPLHKGKSNAFMAKNEIIFDRLYFNYGSKRLIYRIDLSKHIQLFFCHFSLNKKTRLKQFQEINAIIKNSHKETILLADFNILHGFHELNPLTDGTNLRLLSKQEDMTFRFHHHELALDLCLCSENLLDSLVVKVIPQPFSDHEALLVTYTDSENPS